MSQTIERRPTYRLRNAVGPWLDRVARFFVDDTVYVYPEEYATTVRCPVDRLERFLSARGFAWNPLSMYHYTQLGNRTDGSWVYRRSLLADRQLHVVLVEQAPERVDVYAHEEYNWLRHPVKHANEVDMDRPGGAAQVRRLLRDSDLDDTRESVVRRKVEHLQRRVSRRLSEMAPV